MYVDSEYRWCRLVVLYVFGGEFFHYLRYAVVLFFVGLVAVDEGNEIIFSGGDIVAEHKSKSASVAGLHIHSYLANAGSALHKCRSVAIDGAIPVGADGGRYVVAQQIVGFGYAEVEFGPVEIVVFEPTVHLCRSAVAVVYGDIVEGYVAWHYVHRVARRVIHIGVIDLKPQLIGKNIAIEVDIMKVAVKACLTRHFSCNIRCDGLHKWLQETYLGTMCIEVDAQRVACGIYCALYYRGQSVVLSYIGIEIDSFGFVIPITLDIGIAHAALVVGYVFHMQVRCLEYRRA